MPTGVLAPTDRVATPDSEDDDPREVAEGHGRSPDGERSPERPRHRGAGLDPDEHARDRQ